MNGQNNFCTDDFFPYFRVQYEDSYNNPGMTHYHFHDMYEIYYLMAGERYYFIEDKTYHIEKDDLVLINKNIIHKTAKALSSSHYKRACFYFKNTFTESLGDAFTNTDLFSCFNQSFKIMHLSHNQQKFMNTLIEKVSKECLKEPGMYESYIYMLMAELLININRSSTDTNPKPDEAYNPKYKKVFDIVAYINEHYMDDISLTMISRQFYISISGLTRLFKTATGFSFTEYLNNIRIKNAHILLDQTPLTISEIALKVGYSSITHFGRVFKDITSYTPSQYRKTNKFYT